MLKKLIPSIDWLGHYNKNDLRGDLSAGLIVAIMLIPQGMAYAMLAGLPPVIGLYASTIPLIIYALFGSSRQLAVGPVAMVSLLVFTGVSQLAKPGTDEYIAYALLLALMVGVIQLVLGLSRLGFLVNFLSHSVISGFTSAAAIIIGLSQLKNLLGIDIPKGSIFVIISNAIMKVNEINMVTFLIGLGSIIILILLKKMAPKFPAPLVVVVLGILVVRFLQLDQVGVKIVGDIPNGIPAFSIPMFNIEAITALLPIALTISFVSFMESVAVAKSIANKEKYKINANQELNGLGLANIFGSFFSAFPVTGGFSRTAVNYQAGARTGLASIITAVLIFITLQFFTGLFYFLPQAVLAAIIMVAVYGLIDAKEAVHLFKVKKADGWTLLITFIATLTLGIEQGILVGIGVSLLLFIWRSAYPHIAELGYLSDQNVFKNVKYYPNAKTYENLLIYRIDASLYFANMAFVEEKLQQAILEKANINKVILDFSGVNSMDAIALDELTKIIEGYKKSKIEFYIAGIKQPVYELFRKAGLDKKYEGKIDFLSVDQAL
ncbi:SulP family inorganic anion transporter [Sutcliffiella sp. NC1]|uniref:SulP family inorganic anion transporter n=1 Tax=Sutcliffiella sp. NC1 TaxID=3004096 RepID=UPI0022DD310A|nr:solute carrier family 26 protein [Sutcliffiella sp. NC1]WBL12918.1 solute carrier family 26 protein [Sutcliffiella sp. NC1]